MNLLDYLNEGFSSDISRKAFFAKSRRLINKGVDPKSLLKIRPHDGALRFNQGRGGWHTLDVTNPQKLKNMISKIEPRHVKRSTISAKAKSHLYKNAMSGL